MNKQRLVKEFMLKTGRQSVPTSPVVPDLESRKLRVRLILEELIEFAHASGLAISMGGYDLQIASVDILPSAATNPGSVLNTADALADTLYVTYGAAVTWGIAIDPVFMEVHYANMQKFAPGSYERSDGKWMKPPGWQPPDIRAVLESQGYETS